MNNIPGYVLTAVLSYLLGSISFSIIVSRLALSVDVRNYGSGNAGLTNAYRTMGAKFAVYVLIGDFMKGIAAALLGLLFMGTPGLWIASVCVLAGHIFPIYFGFRGGKGILTGAAVLVMIDWRMFLLAFVLFAAVVLFTRFVSLASITAALSFPAGAAFFRFDTVYIVTAAVISATLIFSHRSNIKRLLKGEEPKFKKRTCS